VITVVEHQPDFSKPRIKPSDEEIVSVRTKLLAATKQKLAEIAR